MFKFIFWPFKKIRDWLASGLPAGKEEITPAPAQPEILKCYTHRTWRLDAQPNVLPVARYGPY